MGCYKSIWAVILVVATLQGCDSTPYADDYLPYVNNMYEGSIGEAEVIFQFTNNEKIDLRGSYYNNDTADPTNIMYDASAGLVGMMAQIGTHNAIINSQRREILEHQQNVANAMVSPLISLSQSLTPPSLLSQRTSPWFKTPVTDVDTVSVKPIFFSNMDMDKISLNLIVWIEDPNARKKGDVFYRNTIQVHGKSLNDNERIAIKHKPEALAAELSLLLNTGLEIVSSDLKGNYTTPLNKHRTYRVGGMNERQIVRGVQVDSICQFDVIKSLHQWYIAYVNVEPADEATTVHQC